MHLCSLKSFSNKVLNKAQKMTKLILFTHPLHLSCVLHLWQHESCGQNIRLQNNLHVSFSQATGHRVHPYTLLCTSQIQLCQHLWDGFSSYILKKRKTKYINMNAIIFKAFFSAQLTFQLIFHVIVKNKKTKLFGSISTKRQGWCISSNKLNTK